MSAGDQHDEVLGRLEDVQPRASQFQDEAGVIDWEAYDAAWTTFLDQIPGLSRQFGYQVDYIDFIKWHYRSAAPSKIAYDLYSDFKSANWDKYYALKPELQPGGKYWDEMVQSTATTERLKDLDRGFTPYEADQRYAANLNKYISTGEIPYVYYEEWRNKLLDPLIISDTVNLNTFTFQVAEMMGIDLSDNPLLYNEMSRRLNYELPGMVVADVYDNARDALSTYFYDQLTPQEQQEVANQFGSWGVPKDDTQMYSMYQQVLYYTTPRARFEGPAGDIPPGFNIPPLDSSLTDEEKVEIGQAMVEHYRYQRAREAGVGGTWTELMDKYYGNPDTNQSKFWDLLSYASLSSNSFSDPVMSQIMSRSARSTFEYTDEQWGAAAQYLKDNWDTLIDVEKTQEIKDHPDWWMQAQQQRAEYDRFKDIDMEVAKSQYYGIAWANREDWQEANPEEWAVLEEYLAREKARALQYPYYMYWFKQSDYKKQFGEADPSVVAAGWDVEKVSDDFARAIADMDAFINGSGNWTELMQTFYGPPPEGYVAPTQP
jgi:hypothetical protein